MREALQVERDSEMNSPTAITYPGLPASVISDAAGTKEKVRTRASSNLSRVTRRRTSKRSPSLTSQQMEKITIELEELNMSVRVHIDGPPAECREDYSEVIGRLGPIRWKTRRQ
jgi:hypothetical protein